MAKFSNTTSRTVSRRTTRLPIKTVAEATTFEGGAGYKRDAKSELFFLALNNMVGEDTFYEKADARDKRFRDLIQVVAKQDPNWVAGFIPFLREKMFMRSASTVAAAEYVRSGAPNGRAVVASALQRADEPAEILAYWINVMGYSTASSLPAALKRGVADAAVRLYNENSALKYDGTSRGWRMADVLNVVHPKPKADWQSSLFKYLIDRRFDRPVSAEGLPKIEKYLELQEVPVDSRRAYLKKNREALEEAGVTWEYLSGWIPGGMDAEAWEAIIPNMGYMALLRNLNNFDKADISAKSVKHVKRVLSDPDAVARSKQFPYRFLSAWKAVASGRWADALETALDLSTQNIPELGGSTIIYTDASGSMGSRMSGRSQMSMAEAAAVFAIALAKKCEDARVIQFSTTWKEARIGKNDSVLRRSESFQASGYSLGGGTNTWQAVDATYKGEDRVIILTDMQSFGYYGKVAVLNRIKNPIYAFNLAGYEVADIPAEKNRYQFGGGLSDATFTMLSLLEETGRAGWPF